MYRFATSEASIYASDFVSNVAMGSGVAGYIRVLNGGTQTAFNGGTQTKRISLTAPARSAEVVKMAPPPAGPIAHVLAELRRHAKYEGADAASFEAAEAFLDLVRHWVVGAKSRVQYFDGNAVLNFKRGDVKAQFEFLPDSTIAANIDIGDDEWDEDVTNFDGKALPDQIARRFVAIAHA